MTQQYFVRRDTPTWIFQTWVAFIAALVMCAYGIWQMAGTNMERIFLATGFFFCLSSSFVLAKCIRDNQNEQVDTPMWRIQVWAGFIVSISLTGWGVSTMAMVDWQRAYMVSSWVFLISATFTLAKTIRDNYEADLLEHAAATRTDTQST